MKKIVLALTGLAAMFAVAACGGGGGSVVVSTGSTYVSKTYYDVFGSACGSLKPECTYLDNWSSAKANWTNDPGFSGWGAPFWAEVYDTDLGYYVEAEGFLGYNGIFYDAYDGRAINDADSEQGVDVAKQMALKESDVLANAAKAASAKFDLSLENGMKLARALNDWNKVGKNRERTVADLAAFTKRAMGVDLSQVTNALDTQDSAAIDSLVEQAAANWNKSPEDMKRIIKDIASN